MTTDRVLLTHGAGGSESARLIREVFVEVLGGEALRRLDDAAVLTPPKGKRLAFTTDSFTVRPLFFPGGDIGRLAVAGTVNDLAVMGAEPRFLSLGLIIEEGLLVADLKRIAESIAKTAREAGVEVVTGDTKVVERGSADKVFVNTSGVGFVPAGVDIAAANAKPGDRVIISGPIGNHELAVLLSRGDVHFDADIESDCAPLNGLIAKMIASARAGGSTRRVPIHTMRDITRGGLAGILNEIAAAAGVGMELDEETIPIEEAVRAICMLTGFDSLHLANEGKLVAFVPESVSTTVLRAARRHPLGKGAAAIGRVTADHPTRVVMKTRIGGSRIVDMPLGRNLPRIC
jgi:hydrogenase expression/formation protein HypE